MTGVQISKLARLGVRSRQLNATVRLFLHQFSGLSASLYFASLRQHVKSVKPRKIAPDSIMCPSNLHPPKPAAFPSFPSLLLRRSLNRQHKAFEDDKLPTKRANELQEPSQDGHGLNLFGCTGRTTNTGSLQKDELPVVSNITWLSHATTKVLLTLIILLIRRQDLEDQELGLMHSAANDSDMPTRPDNNINNPPLFWWLQRLFIIEIRGQNSKRALTRRWETGIRPPNVVAAIVVDYVVDRTRWSPATGDKFRIHVYNKRAA